MIGFFGILFVIGINIKLSKYNTLDRYYLAPPIQNDIEKYEKKDFEFCSLNYRFKG